MELCANNESPLDIMFDNMLFWSRQTKDLGAKLQKLFGRIEGDEDRREAMSLTRLFLAARESALGQGLEVVALPHAAHTRG
jgi:hypothetical protein